MVMLAVVPCAWGEVAITEANFPDELFREYVSRNFDTDGDGILSEGEIASATQIDVEPSLWRDETGGYTSLKGIEHFTSLKELRCGNNKLTELDVSKNTALTSLSCYDNQLTGLDLSRNTALATLQCGGNKLTALDLSKNTALTELNCYGNPIVSLDLSACLDLVYLSCAKNSFDILDVSNHTKLEYVDCSIYWGFEDAPENASPLVSIDVSGCTSLQTLECGGNGSIKYVNVKGCTSLQRLSCYDNLISAVDLSGLTRLENANFTSNKLTSISVEGCTSLKDLSLGGNQFTSLNVSGLASLEDLMCWGNSLTELNVSGCTSLSWLNCMDNQLTVLDVSNNTAIGQLNCYNNRLASLNVTGCSELYRLTCYSNDLIALDLSGCYGLYELNCLSNDISTIDLSDCNADLYDEMAGNSAYAGVQFIREAKSKPVILTESLDVALTGDTFWQQLSATGGAITWTATKSLPKPFTLTSGGSIETEEELKSAKTYTFTVIASNALGKAEKTFTLTVYAPVEFVTETLKNGTVGKKYSAQVKVKGSKPITFSAEGLPAGLTINPSTGKITGTPTETGYFDVTVTVSNPVTEEEMWYDLEIVGIPPKISGSLAKPEIGKHYSSKLKLTKGTEPVSWSIDGDIPEGLEIDEDTSEISGTPEWGGTYKFIVWAVNDWGEASKKVTMTVKGKKPAIKTGKLPNATVGEWYGVKLIATGSEPFIWAVDSLPDGLVLSGDAEDVIMGVPTEASKGFKIKVTVTNPVGSKSKTLTLKINAAKSAKASPSDDDAGNIPGSAGTISGGTTMAVSPETVIVRAGNGTRNSGGYVIVAELGVISADEAGMYDFTVTLSDYAHEGAELVYLANSDNPSDDDDIAEFWDVDGEPITAVPDDKRITISVWLNPETVYSPVIAVRK